MSCVSSVAVYGVVLPPSPIVFFHVSSSLLSLSLGEVHFNETRLSSVWRMDGMIFKSSFGAWSVGGKASQEDSSRLHASNLSSQRTHRDSHTGGWRIIPREKLDGAAPHARSTPREAPTCVSADASTRLPAEPSSCPLAIKPFPNNVGSSVTKTAPANIIRPANMAVATLIGELWPSCHQVFINSSACCHQVPF